MTKKEEEIKLMKEFLKKLKLKNKRIIGHPVYRIEYKIISVERVGTVYE